MNCPQCKKTKLELFEDDESGNRYTCKKCGIFVDIKEIDDKEVLDMIGYEDDDDA